MYRATDKLAFAIASPEPLPRSYFRKVFNHLYLTIAVPAGFRLEEIDQHRRVTELNLEALSICDFEFDEQQTIRSCPPFLGLQPHSGFPTALLFGARTPNTRQRLRLATRAYKNEAAFATFEQPAFPLLPYRLSVKAKDILTLLGIAQAANIPLLQTPPSWSLLSYSESVTGYIATLPWKDGLPSLNWRREDFDIRTLSFRGVPLEDSLRLSRYRHPQLPHRYAYYLVESGRSAEVDPTWTRFYILGRNNHPTLHYDQEKRVLFMPPFLPLPRLLARGLVACSGIAPQVIATHDGLMYNTYVQIPPRYAWLLAQKLGQTLNLAPIAGSPRGLND